MTRPRIGAALCLLGALAAPLFAGPRPAGTNPAGAKPDAPSPKAAQVVPAYDVLYLADSTDGNGPQAVVRTAARAEEGWVAIGRDLRAKRPDFKVMVVHFYSDHAPLLPKGYPHCTEEQCRAFEGWLLGTYAYQSKSYKFNKSGRDMESVRQTLVTLKERTFEDVAVTQLRATDPRTAIMTPATMRFAQVAVVVPGLHPDDLEKVAQAYESEYGTPRLLRIDFFDSLPDWPDKPFATQAFFDHAARAYVRASTVKGSGAEQRVVPEPPHWVTLVHGKVIKDESTPPSSN